MPGNSWYNAFVKKQGSTLADHKHPAHKVFTVGGMIAISILALSALGVAAFYSRTFLMSENLAAVIASVLVDLTNDDREDQGLHTLTVNPLLVAAAQAKANDMAENGYFAHNSPDGKTPWYWLKGAGYSFTNAGENLAVNFNDSEDVEEAWMESPSHRENIVNEKFTEIGIATAVGTYKGKKATFVVQMFGRPSVSAVATAPAVVVTIPSAPTAVLGSETEQTGPEEEVPAPVVTTPSTPESIATEAPQAAEAPIAASIEQPKADANEPAPVVATEKISYAPAWGFLATSPKAVLRTVYLASVLLLLLSLVLITRMEFKQHHLRHVAAAAVLIVFMGSLFLAAERFVFAEPVLAQLPALGDV